MNVALDPSPRCGCDQVSRSTPLISIDEALERISATARCVAGTEVLTLSQAKGRILARPVVTQSPLPEFDNAGMDGYAINTNALTGAGPWELPVVDRIPAGLHANAAISGDEAIRIFTGAEIPRGANAVVMQEMVSVLEGRIRLLTKPRDGENIRRSGEDALAGQTILQPQSRLSASAIAAAAATGTSHVTVRRALRVAIVISGNEVARSKRDHGAARVWDVNTPMLQAIADRSDVAVVATESVGDDRDQTRNLLDGLVARADLIVTTGGISVGEEDHVKPAFLDLGARLVFSGVAVKPGKPVTFGQLGTTHWLGLPGNPHSAFATWQMFGTALIDALSGARSQRPSRWPVVLSAPIDRQPGRAELRPVRLDGADAFGRMRATPSCGVHSGRITELSKMDGHVILPPDTEHLPAGSIVPFQPYDSR